MINMKFIQISDTHLFSHDNHDIFGVHSNITFQEVIDKISLEDSYNADGIFLTGDISQDKTIASYEKAVRVLQKLNLPVYWVPGNHDNLSQMTSVFQNADNFMFTSSLSLPNWTFIFLNTAVDNADEGYLTPNEFERLKNELSASPQNKKIAIIMHHHPIEVSTPLIDRYILRNKDEFWNIVAHPEVKLIICGHVHGDYTLQHNDVMIESAPATCLQWKKGCTKLEIENKIGYKIYYFDPNSYKSTSKIW